MADFKPSRPTTLTGRRFWIGWELASILAWSLGGLTVKLVGGSEEIITTGYLGILCAAALSGLLQWPLLRHRIDHAGRWALASLATAAGLAPLIFGVGLVDPDAGWVAGVLLFGPSAAFLQWRVLRGQVAKAGLWIPVSTLGWIGGGLAGDPLGWPGIGRVYGAGTGFLLLKLWRHPLSDPTTIDSEEEAA